MEKKFNNFVVYEKTLIIEALQKIDLNKQGFVIVVDIKGILLGVLTDGDIRRGLLKGLSIDHKVLDFYTKNAVVVNLSEGMNTIINYFKNEKIKFIPIVNANGQMINIITKAQMHALLLQDINADLMYDFMSLDVGIINNEIFSRPWGYYKTTVLNEYFQGKIISVRPGAKLSLQSHNHREEHWIVVHGNGIVQLDDSSVRVECGSVVFIPKGCKHRLINTDVKENLIITEVQIGDYFGEDDIVRYEDIYGRV